jgi:2-aminoadipate transaminase
MGNIFSDRISDVPRSFIREILKFTIDESVISFAGGLPNRDLFPLKEIKAATNKILDTAGRDVLQYSTSEGYWELREWITERYKLKGVVVNPNNVLITTGSQQGLDLLSKTILNEGDNVVIEEPAYLGAIQAFSIYRSKFFPIPLTMDGIDTDTFEKTIAKNNIKLFYCVPNFQNPSGISYSEKNRNAVASMLKNKSTILIEDNPYGDLRFLGEEKLSFYQLIPENTVLLGSFSKIVVPSFRIGWIVANTEIMEKLIVAKQASDLHTNYFGQRIIFRYLKDNNIDDHINIIRNAYRSQRNAMVMAIKDYFPAEVQYTQPEGGMFLWITLPEGLSAMEVFKHAIEQKVAFVPSNPFYVNKKDVSTMRLNFSSVDEKTIRIGIKRLAEVIKSMLS